MAKSPHTSEIHRDQGEDGALAARARLLRDYLAQELSRQQTQQGDGRLFALYGVFSEQIFHEMRISGEEFAPKYKVLDNRDGPFSEARGGVHDHHRT